MTERDAFLAAIAANPDDDLPRLVFADWLDERNDPQAFDQREAVARRRVVAQPAEDRPRLEYAAVCEQYAGEVKCQRCDVRKSEWETGAGFEYEVNCRTCCGSGRVSDGRKELAEFIRVQCELSKLEARNLRCIFNPVVAGRDVCHCQKCSPERPLRTRERELFVIEKFGGKAVRTHWRGQFPEGVEFHLRGGHGGRRGTVWPVRGFPGEVVCALADWCGGDCEWSGYEGDHAECRHCDGTGTRKGIGPAVVARHPVERVVLSDREPTLNTWDFMWRWVIDIPAARADGDENNRCLLPEAVWKLLPDWDRKTLHARTYATREDAMSAASTALIAWAKGTA